MGHLYRRTQTIRVRVMRTEDAHGNVSCFIDRSGKLPCKHVLAIDRAAKELVAVLEPFDKTTHRWPTVEEYDNARSYGKLPQ